MAERIGAYERVGVGIFLTGHSDEMRDEWSETGVRTF